MPKSFSATPGDTEVVLNWVAPDSDGGSEITGYEYRQQESSEAWQTWTPVPDSGVSGGNKTSYTVTNLDNGTSYNFELRAVNEDSDYSSVASISMYIEPTASGTPFQILQRISRGFPQMEKVFLAWDPPANDGGSSITKYQYQYQNNGTWPANWFDIPDSGVGEDNEDEFCRFRQM